MGRLSPGRHLRQSSPGTRSIPCPACDRFVRRCRRRWRWPSCRPWRSCRPTDSPRFSGSWTRWRRRNRVGGYRRVRPDAEPTGPRVGRRLMAVLGAAVLVAATWWLVAGRTRDSGLTEARALLTAVAVLPFQDLRGSPDSAYLGGGDDGGAHCRPGPDRLPEGDLALLGRRGPGDGAVAGRARDATSASTPW